MNKKAKSYVLLLIVVAVWGILIYKFVGDLSGDVVIDKSIQASTFSMPEAKEKEKYNLIPITKDPFLGTIAKSQRRTSAKTVKQPDIDWPQIEYRGLVKGEKNSAYILRVNGQDMIFNRSEELNELTLVKGNEKQITVRYKGKTKTIDL